MQKDKLHQQSGQALVLGMLFLAILSLALVALYDNGRLIGERIRQTHAVDAAAYSGALIQARALNMQAYINLAQVGHQMAMAHLVTLGSWARLSSTEGEQFGRANPPAYVIAMHFGVQHGSAYTASSRSRAISTIAHRNNELHQQFARHDQMVENVLVGVSQAIKRTMETSRDLAIQRVLESNFPQKRIRAIDVVESTRSELQTFRSDRQKVNVEHGVDGELDVSWRLKSPSYASFSTVFKPKANYRSLITEVAGIYRFLDARDNTARSLLPVSMRCPTWRHELRRRGATILNAQGNWQSIDTQSYHALRSNKWIGCYYREYSMGWGWIPGQSNSVPAGIEYTEEPPDNFSTQDFWRWVQSATNWNIFSGLSNPLANSRAIRDRQRWSGGGLVPYVDIKNAAEFSHLDFILELKQYGVRGHQVNTVSAAQTFFERPTQRRDGQFETANLWHPYWQARLIDKAQVGQQKGNLP